MKKRWKVDIVFPVYYGNIDILEDSTIEVLKHVKKIQDSYLFKIIISVNGPKAEKIIEKAKSICRKNDSVSCIYIKNQGKGYGVLNAWRNSSADILAYMDIDLSTSLKSFNSLIDEIRKGADIAVGSRYLTTSKIKRSLRRYVLSRIYHIFLINMFLRLPIKDVQCGFKAIHKNAFLRLSSDISNKVFFFEAEMLYLAQGLKMKIVEVPVFWIECEVTGVKLIRTSLSFFLNVLRIKFRHSFKQKKVAVR
jgi:glycosyltransferase involved in cell wall biosynthesis